LNLPSLTRSRRLLW
jgi:hypothetical protein